MIDYFMAFMLLRFFVLSCAWIPGYQSSDPADKDAWKDKGMGQLSIKCKEGVSKGTKESKPTIVIRNDVGSFWDIVNPSAHMLLKFWYLFFPLFGSLYITLMYFYAWKIESDLLHGFMFLCLKFRREGDQNLQLRLHYKMRNVCRF